VREVGRIAAEALSERHALAATLVLRDDRFRAHQVAVDAVSPCREASDLNAPGSRAIFRTSARS